MIVGWCYLCAPSSTASCLLGLGRTEQWGDSESHSKLRGTPVTAAVWVVAGCYPAGCWYLEQQ